MRAVARRLNEQFTPDAMPLPALVPDDLDLGKINALEAPDGLGAEQIPDRWTPEHVCKRIVEAFETLTKQPPLRGPRTPGNNWPEVMIEWEDQLAQVTSEAAEHRARARNRVRTMPTAIDLRRMELVLEWLSSLYRVDPGLCRVVQRWAKLRASGKSVKADCRNTGLSFQVFYRQRDKGVARIIDAIVGTAVW